jgi:hypothetical protein
MVTLFSSCSRTTSGSGKTYKNYHRSGIKTPVQYYTTSTPESIFQMEKGRMQLSGSYNNSGQDDLAPKNSSTGQPGRASLTSVKHYDGQLTYAFHKNWQASLRMVRGKGERTIYINEYNVEDSWDDIIADLLFLGLLNSNQPTFSGNVDNVKRKYQSWETALSAGYFLPQTEGRLSMHFGLTKGRSDMIGTTHAEDPKLRPTAATSEIPPATYGSHHSNYFGAFVQPGILLSKLKSRAFEFGFSSKVSYLHNSVTSKIFGINYKESPQHVLCQPSITLGFGNKHFKVIFGYSYLIPIYNPTHDYFNEQYTHLGVRLGLSTISKKTK